MVDQRSQTIIKDHNKHRIGTSAILCGMDPEVGQLCDRKTLLKYGQFVYEFGGSDDCVDSELKGANEENAMKLQTFGKSS